MELPTFLEFYNMVKDVEEAINTCDGTIDNFFEIIEAKQLNLETVMTSDIAQMTLPIGRMKRRHPDKVYEVAPDNPEAEQFIKKNKLAFKRRYGENWERVLYSTSWKLFGEKSKKQE